MSSIHFEPSLTQTQRQSGRIQWVNIAKGIGIILVVFGHVGRGVIDRDNATTKQGITATVSAIHQYVSLDNAMYAFHMALFFFLSGLFVERGAQKSSVQFFGQKLRTIVYPYFIWSIIQSLFVALASAHVRGQISARDVIRKLPWETYAQFWFLYVLMLCMTVYWLFYKLRLGRTAITGIALAIYLLGQRVHLSDHGKALAYLSEWSVLYQTRMYFFYFAAGASCAPILLRPSKQLPAIVLTLAGAAMLIAEYWLAKDFDPDHVPAHLRAIGDFAISHGLNARDWVAVLPAALGIAGTIAIAMAIDQHRIGGLLEWLGELSLPIYAAQVIAAAAIRVALQKVLHIHQFGPHLILGTVAGLAVPVILDVFALRVGFNYLFTFGATKPANKNKPGQIQPQIPAGIPVV